MCDLNMACLWPSFGMDLDSLGAGFGTVLCLGCGMFMWLYVWTALWASLMPQLVLRTKLSLLAFD